MSAEPFEPEALDPPTHPRHVEESSAISLKRIADALEDLVALISQIEHVAERELRARRVFPPDEGSDANV